MNIEGRDWVLSQKDWVLAWTWLCVWASFLASLSLSLLGLILAGLMRVF